ncbi:MAG: Nramp family divalent metal transporter [Flavobacteriaceae bacterium]|jgi:Mn2+/Fe2+ NRAMP family transporter|tara:strand:+ start:1077 stop:2294 length:1218 start_codon:yes stop_codon:yes gene_type:complete
MKNTLQKLGPGLLFAGAAIGVSHLVQSTRAGADFGLGLLWALLLVNFFKYPFFQFGPRYALATGESLLAGYAKLGKGVIVTYFVLTIATMFTIQTAVTIVTAGLAVELLGISSNIVYWGVVITLICATLLSFGRYGLLDRGMKVIIIVLSISTFVAAFLAFGQSKDIEWTQVLPTSTTGFAFLIAFMGWMPGPLDISVWHSLWSLEKKKRMQNLTVKQSLFDFNVGYLTTIVLGVCFVLLGTLVMYGTGIGFSSSGGAFAQQLIALYTSSLGNGAYWIIGVAAFTTMFSTTLTTLDASPRAMAKTAQILQLPIVMSSYLFWILVLVIGTCAVFFFLLSNMGALVQLATILSFITAPFYGLINFLLVSGRHMPENYRPNGLMRVWSIAGLVFLTGFTIWYLSTFLI